MNTGVSGVGVPRFLELLLRPLSWVPGAVLLGQYLGGGGEGGLERPLTESPQCLAGVGVPREEGAAVLAMVRD